MRAVFLDRDGVLIPDVGLSINYRQARLFTYVPEALRMLRDSGFLLIVVTNQAVVARGLSTEQGVGEIHTELQDQLTGVGDVRIDRFYFCPHHPRATLSAYRSNCQCRKPMPGMLLQASREFGIDLGKSWMIGDRISDIAAGRSAGCKTILVQSGMHEEPPIEGAGCASDLSPDALCEDLLDATRHIVSMVR